MSAIILCLIFVSDKIKDNFNINRLHPKKMSNLVEDFLEVLRNPYIDLRLDPLLEVSVT